MGEIEIKRPELPELNRELLVKVVDHALSAENWNQRAWYQAQDYRTLCGTSMCVAGFAAIEFAGWKPVMENSVAADYCTKDGYQKPIAQVAREELGLTRDEAGDLFHSRNNAEDIRQITQDILDGVYRG